MDFGYGDKSKDVRDRVVAFMAEHVYPNQAGMEELKTKAKMEGLWNLFLPDSEHGAGQRRDGRSKRSAAAALDFVAGWGRSTPGGENFVW